LTAFDCPEEYGDFQGPDTICEAGICPCIICLEDDNSSGDSDSGSDSDSDSDSVGDSDSDSDSDGGGCPPENPGCCCTGWQNTKHAAHYQNETAGACLERCEALADIDPAIPCHWTGHYFYGDCTGHHGDDCPHADIGEHMGCGTGFICCMAQGNGSENDDCYEAGQNDIHTREDCEQLGGTSIAKDIMYRLENGNIVSRSRGCNNDDPEGDRCNACAGRCCDPNCKNGTQKPEDCCGGATGGIGHTVGINTCKLRDDVYGGGRGDFKSISGCDRSWGSVCGGTIQPHMCHGCEKMTEPCQSSTAGHDDWVEETPPYIQGLCCMVCEEISASDLDETNCDETDAKYDPANFGQCAPCQEWSPDPPNCKSDAWKDKLATEQECDIMGGIWIGTKEEVNLYGGYEEQDWRNLSTAMCNGFAHQTCSKLFNLPYDCSWAWDQDQRCFENEAECGGPDGDTFYDTAKNCFSAKNGCDPYDDMETDFQQLQCEYWCGGAGCEEFTEPPDDPPDETFCWWGAVSLHDFGQCSCYEWEHGKPICWEQTTGIIECPCDDDSPLCNCSDHEPCEACSGAGLAEGGTPEYTNVQLDNGECIYMECVPPFCPYPLCTEVNPHG